MMNVLTQIQLTEEQKALLEGGEIVRFEASWDEFTDFLETTDYRIEYCNGEIIVMGLAKALHEWLVIRIANILSNFYEGKDYFVFGSNLGIHPSPKGKYHDADVTVVKGNIDFWGNSKAIITNPYIIVEVLSESTQQYDLNEKMESYSEIESIQQMIFIGGEPQKVITYTRTEEVNSWLRTSYTKPDDTLVLDNFTVKLSAIFANMPSIPK